MNRFGPIDAEIIADREHVLRALEANGGDMTIHDIGKQAFSAMNGRGMDRYVRVLRALRRAQSDGLVVVVNDDNDNVVWRRSTRAGARQFERRREQEILRHGHALARTTA